MTRTHRIIANGVEFSTRSGEVVLSSALMNGVPYPHDCRAGRCGSCLSKVLSGLTIGGETVQKGMVHACLAHALSDVELEYAPLPPVQSVSAKVSALIRRSQDVVEVQLQLSNALALEPGQYCRFKFRGFPERSFSPTSPANGDVPTAGITLHVKQVRGGLVSNALGREIGPGHPVRVEGPFGSAFYRPGTAGRIVLVAGGTGFAPIYAIARAALMDDPNREMLLVVGGRQMNSLYMAEVLPKLSRYPGVNLVVTVADPPEQYAVLKRGTPTDHIPTLHGDDVIYAAGAPAMVTRLAAMAEDVGALFYADPFEAEPERGMKYSIADAFCKPLPATTGYRPVPIATQAK